MADTTKGRSSGLAIAGLVLGILAAASSFLPIINNLSAIIAVVGGILSAAAFVGANKGKHDAKGMSIAGIVLAIVSFVIVLATQSMYSAALKSAAEELKTGSKPVETTEQQSPDQNAPAEQAPAEQAPAEPAPAEPAPAEPAPEEQAPAEQAVDWSHMPLGQTVTLEDGLSITANSVGIVNRSYGDEQLACVSVTYVNNGSSNASFNIFDWKSENANGVQTSASYYSSDNEQLESGQLVPGGTITANVYFSADATRILYFSNIFQSESQIGWVIA